MRSRLMHQFVTLEGTRTWVLQYGGAAAWAKTNKLLVSAPWPSPITNFIGGGKKPGFASHGMRRTAQILALLAGFGGLLGSLLLLDREPLFGVLGMLGSMALLLESLTRFRGASTTLFRTRHTEEITDGREH